MLPGLSISKQKSNIIINEDLNCLYKTIEIYIEGNITGKEVIEFLFKLDQAHDVDRLRIVLSNFDLSDDLALTIHSKLKELLESEIDIEIEVNNTVNITTVILLCVKGVRYIYGAGVNFALGEYINNCRKEKASFSDYGIVYLNVLTKNFLKKFYSKLDLDDLDSFKSTYPIQEYKDILDEKVVANSEFQVMDLDNAFFE